MTIPRAIELCGVFSDAVLDFPFGPDWAVMRHGASGKVFALIYERDDRVCINLKAPPAEVCVLSQAYPFITVGYHMNKRHWLTVLLGADVPQPLLEQLIEQSYRLTLPAPRKGG